ncbi:MAG: hypothetical protein H6696_06620 [Deferribacteres bacterium]|nr:hypothetical protein [candidate division KSB1 bacterium]MCB9501594.1 hypothetical protein [Deferribacteres bacterium]
MKAVIKLISYVGLILTIVPSLLVFSGTITLDMCKWLMLLGTIIWFVSAPTWMNQTS